MGAPPPKGPRRGNRGPAYKRAPPHARTGTQPGERAGHRRGSVAARGSPTTPPVAPLAMGQAGSIGTTIPCSSQSRRTSQTAPRPIGRNPPEPVSPSRPRLSSLPTGAWASRATSAPAGHSRWQRNSAHSANSKRLCGRTSALSRKRGAVHGNHRHHCALAVCTAGGALSRPHDALEATGSTLLILAPSGAVSCSGPAAGRSAIATIFASRSSPHTAHVRHGVVAPDRSGPVERRAPSPSAPPPRPAPPARAAAPDRRAGRSHQSPQRRAARLGRARTAGVAAPQDLRWPPGPRRAC
jgi:hypothetical protein